MTTHPCDFYASPDVKALRAEYVGKTLADIPTPAFVVNRQIVKDNCQRMLLRAERLGANFRAHVKTHKCNEGVELQLGGKCERVVVSTLMEAWKMMPFYKSGQIIDVLYGLPVVKSRLPELVELKKHVPNVRLMVDHPSQIDLLTSLPAGQPWSVFVKVNMGTNRAGLAAGTDDLEVMISKIVHDKGVHVSLYGFYCHAGHSYASATEKEAAEFLYKEIEAANEAAILAKCLDSSLDLVLSVGSTPTSHASEIADLSRLANLSGKVELHGGNYPFCDLQQMATQCITQDNVACSVVAEVASCYPSRGASAPGEVLINAGVIAMAREPGPVPGFGKVITPGLDGWSVGRLSQEHGILVPTSGKETLPELGSRVRIIPQHSCITANAYQWYYVTDGDEKVVDIWVTWRGW